MPRRSRAGRRKYQRFYMRVWRAEKRGKSEKGGTIGGVGEERIHKGRNPYLLVPNVSPEISPWVVEQIKLLQVRVTILEADRALLEALVRQAEEWSS